LESLGRRFMRERERRKLTLEDISASTKIRVRYLVAIEHELFDQLPGGIVSEGFIRAYARELAMDDQQAVADADYLAAVQPTPGSDPQPPPEPARGHTTRSLATRVSWEVLVAALCGKKKFRGPWLRSPPKASSASQFPAVCAADGAAAIPPLSWRLIRIQIAQIVRQSRFSV